MIQELLAVKPDTKEYVRKLYNLDKPEKLEQAIEILDQWIKRQNHYVKKDYDKKYLEMTLYDTKGSIEKAKEKLEKRCIFRTLVPVYFETTDVRKDFGDFVSKNIAGIPLPKLTPEHYRVIVIKAFNETFDSVNITDYFQFSFIINEFLKLYDCCAGYIFLIDMSDISVMDVIAKLKIVVFRHWITFLLEAQGFRLKHLVYVTPSKAIDAFLKIVKPLFSKKMADRITVFKDIEEVFDLIPKEVLPVELGGTERSYKDIQDDWMDFLCKQENLDYLKDIGQARINENIKKINKNDNFVESTGSFVTLEFD